MIYADGTNLHEDENENAAYTVELALRHMSLASATEARLTLIPTALLLRSANLQWHRLQAVDYQEVVGSTT